MCPQCLSNIPVIDFISWSSSFFQCWWMWCDSFVPFYSPMLQGQCMCPSGLHQYHWAVMKIPQMGLNENLFGLIPESLYHGVSWNGFLRDPLFHKYIAIFWLCLNAIFSKLLCPYWFFIRRLDFTPINWFNVNQVFRGHIFHWSHHVFGISKYEISNGNIN